MQYLNRNFSSKSAARNHLKEGHKITVNIVEPMISGRPKRDKVFGDVVEHVIAGPWYPEPHRWYGTATVKDGYVVKIK